MVQITVQNVRMFHSPLKNLFDSSITFVLRAGTLCEPLQLLRYLRPEHICGANAINGVWLAPRIRCVNKRTIRDSDEVGGKSPRASRGMRADASFIFLTHHIVIVCLAERAGRTRHGTCRSDACGDQDLRNPPSTRSRSETVPPKGDLRCGCVGTESGR